jgi:hypothetical protein
MKPCFRPYKLLPLEHSRYVYPPIERASAPRPRQLNSIPTAISAFLLPGKQLIIVCYRPRIRLGQQTHSMSSLQHDQCHSGLHPASTHAHQD